jgi:hypothetical protein
MLSPKERQERNNARIVKSLYRRNAKKPYVTDIKGNPIVFNALTEKPFRFTAKQRIDRTPELSERRARAIAYADSLSQAQTNLIADNLSSLIADNLSSKPGRKFSDLNEAIQLIDPDGAAGAKDILSNKDEANTFLKRVLSRSNSVMSESLRSDSQDSVDPDRPIEVLGKFNKMYENKKVLDFFDDNSFVFSLNRNCSISYNTDTNTEGNHIINITFFTCAPFSPIFDPEQSDDNSSIKGSGALMLLELLSFLGTKGSNGYKYTANDYVYLDPEPIGDKRYEDRSMEDLYSYYMSLNFERVGRNTMRATIKAIFSSPRAKGVIENFKKLTKPSDSAGKGGRRKLTKRKRRKTRKSRKSRRRR